MGRIKKLCLLFIIAVILSLPGIAGCRNDKEPKADLILATTTSTQDSGLLDVLLPVFEKEYGLKVKVVAVGSGQAMQMGRKGDADVLLVHSPQEEEKFVEEGWGVKRHPVMHNRFILVGPEENPAGIADGDDIITALKKIEKTESLFVSRADKSGTHMREMALWEEAGIKPEGSWYLETGQGMGETLMIADEKGAYTLTDESTYLSFRNKGRIELKVWIEEDARLFNSYSVIAVNEKKHPHVNKEGAAKFIAFITGPEGQKIIQEFGVKEYGKPLFIPDNL